VQTSCQGQNKYSASKTGRQPLKEFYDVGCDKASKFRLDRFPQKEKTIKRKRRTKGRMVAMIPEPTTLIPKIKVTHKLKMTKMPP